MKARITRRMMHQYQRILANNACFMYPHFCASGTNLGRQIPGDGIEWAAYYFCKRWQGRCGYDAKKLQRTVLLSGNPEVAYVFARDIREASVCKLEKIVVEAGDPKWMRLFAQLPKARKKLLMDFAFLTETMSI